MPPGGGQLRAINGFEYAQLKSWNSLQGHAIVPAGLCPV
jgi:hypothetical protein